LTRSIGIIARVLGLILRNVQDDCRSAARDSKDLSFAGRRVHRVLSAIDSHGTRPSRRSFKSWTPTAEYNLVVRGLIDKTENEL
jgi:hypothetical protein